MGPVNLRIVAAGAAALASLGSARHVALRSGVSAADIAGPMPGDALVPDATHTIDRATTLPAPAEQVWPWIVQLGKGRAGWYFPRWTELAIPLSRRGLREIDPELQRIAVGDEHPDWGPGDPVLRVAELQPGASIAYHSLRDRRRGHRWPLAGYEHDDEVFAMSWTLAVSDASPGESRLHLRLRLRARSRALPVAELGGLFDWATVELMFAGLRERLAG